MALKYFVRLRDIATAYRVPFDLDEVGDDPAKLHIFELVTNIADMESRIHRAVSRVTADLGTVTKLVDDPATLLSDSGILQGTATNVDLLVVQLAVLRAQLTRSIAVMFPAS